MALFGQNLPKFGLYLANLAGCCNSWKSLKNLKVGVFETDFKQVPFVFWQTTCTYSESWGPVEKSYLKSEKWVRNSHFTPILGAFFLIRMYRGIGIFVK